ncbi:MAG TPA: hypothetical protein VLE46_07415 [Nitrospira sp.]|nr:hypothetical protein [Nitrospira sp.]
MQQAITVCSLLVLAFGAFPSCAGDRHDRGSTAYRDNDQETARDRERDRRGTESNIYPDRWGPHPNGGPAQSR